MRHKGVTLLGARLGLDEGDRQDGAVDEAEVTDDAASSDVADDPGTLLAVTVDPSRLGVGAVEGNAVFDCAGIPDAMLSVDVAGMLDATLDHAEVGLAWGRTVSERPGKSPLFGVSGLTGVAVSWEVNGDSADVSDTMRVMGMKACPTPHSSEQNPV